MDESLERSVILRTLFLLFTFCLSATASCESIFIDAAANALGPNGGEYVRVVVDPNVLYEVSVESIDAIFNTQEGGDIVEVGVMYVEPPRRMKIESISQGVSARIRTEGNVYLFFVDDALLNSGGAQVSIEVAGAELSLFDIDRDGTVGALTDGLLIMRSLFGFQGRNADQRCYITRLFTLYT
jgi:hypothetical protein